MEDFRLGLGYAALIVAAACFGWDYKLGWEATKLWTACAVGLYAALNGGLTLWVWLVEQGTVYQGTCPGKDAGRQLYIATSAKKGDPVYKLKVAILDGGKDADGKGFEFEVPFASFFNEAGYFVPEPFQRMLVKNISVVATADPKRVAAVTDTKADVNEKKSTASVETQALLDDNPELLDAVLQAEAQTTGTEKKKGGKKRKA